MTATPSERGIALAASIFALVLIAALVTGALFAARMEMRTGENTESAQQAFSAANAGLDYAIANWKSAIWNQLPTGGTVSLSASMPSGTASWSGTVQRLNSDLFLVQMTGKDKYGFASRELGQLVRLRFIQLSVKGAVTTQSNLQLGGSAFIDGVDTNPSGWSCPAVNDTMPGIATNDSASISLSGCTNYKCVDGSPKINQDTSIHASTFTQFGDLTWNDLVAMATITYPSSYGPASDFGPVGTDSTCDDSVKDNWGDPMVPASVPGCSNYFPIIYVNGDLQVTGGYGQGILLVQGDLSVQGGWQFFGPVIVTGTVSTQGTGGHFNGGLMAANVDMEQNAALGNALVTYSSCIISKATQANSPGRRLSGRSWMDEF